MLAVNFSKRYLVYYFWYGPANILSLFERVWVCPVEFNAMSWCVFRDERKTLYTHFLLHIEARFVFIDSFLIHLFIVSGVYFKLTKLILKFYLSRNNLVVNPLMSMDFSWKENIYFQEQCYGYKVSVTAVSLLGAAKIMFSSILQYYKFAVKLFRAMLSVQ